MNPKKINFGLCSDILMKVRGGKERGVFIIHYRNKMDIYIYIYIYIEREREREGRCVFVAIGPADKCFENIWVRFYDRAINTLLSMLGLYLRFLFSRKRSLPPPSEKHDSNISEQYFLSHKISVMIFNIGSCSLCLCVCWSPYSS